MAGSLNKVTLIGNVGREPEFRQMPDGREMVSFSVATSDQWKDKTTGEKKELTEWHRVAIFNEGLVGVVKRYVKKGSKVFIEGALRTRKWVDASTGQDKYTTEIVLQGFSSQLILLDAKGQEVGFQDSQESTGSPASSSHFDHSELDDEIPF